LALIIFGQSCPTHDVSPSSWPGVDPAMTARTNVITGLDPVI